jgi:hypothetical protein
MAPVQSVYYTDNDAVEAIEKRSNKNRALNDMWSRYKRLHNNIDTLNNSIVRYIEGIDNTRAAIKIEIYNKVQGGIIPKLETLRANIDDVMKQLKENKLINKTGYIKMFLINQQAIDTVAINKGIAFLEPYAKLSRQEMVADMQKHFGALVGTAGLKLIDPQYFSKICWEQDLV